MSWMSLLERIAGMDSWNQPTCPINIHKSPFGSASHLENIGSWKAGSPVSNPLLLKSECVRFFIALWLLLHGNMGPTFARCHDATTNGLGDHNPKNLFETWLWQAWVAWIERGQQIWVQKIYDEESFESITDSQLKYRPWCWSWIVTPNSKIHSYRLSDLFMSWMSLLERIAGIWRVWIPWTNRSSKSPFGCASHFPTMGSWKAGSPASNPLLLKAQSRQLFIGLQQSHVTTESTISCNPNLGYLNSLFCKHDATIM